MKKFTIALTVIIAINFAPQGSFGASNNASWSMAGCTPDRRHASSAKIQPPLDYSWDTGQEGSIWSVPPLASGSACYLGMSKPPEKGIYQTSIQKRVLSSGSIAWEYKEAWWPWALYKGDLICQGYSNEKQYSWVRRINGESRATVWEIEWLRYTIGAIIDGDIIYSLSYSDVKDDNDKDQRIFFFQAHSAENGKLIWKKSYEHNITMVPWFCIQGDYLYGSIFKTIYKLDKNTGAEIWKIQSNERIGRGSYIVGTEKGILVNTVYDRLNCISPEDGKTIWSKRLSDYESSDPDNCGMPSGTPSILGNRVYIVSRGSKDKNQPKVVYCLDLGTGKTVWQVALQGTSTIEGSDIGHTTTVANGVLYTMTEDNSGLNTKLRAFDPENGMLLWQDSIPGVPNPSEMTVVSGYLVIGMEVHRLEHKETDPVKSDFSYRCYTNIGVKPPVLYVEENELNFGYTNEKKAISKKIKIQNDGTGELSGVLTSDDDWLFVSPTQFSGNNTEIMVIADITKLSPGIHKSAINIKSNGGKKTIPVLVAFGGGQEPQAKSEKVVIRCSETQTFKKIVKLSGYNHGDVTVKAPWLIVNPIVFDGEDVSVVFIINKNLLSKANNTGTAQIKSNAFKIDLSFEVVGFSDPMTIIMWIGKDETLVNGKKVKLEAPPMITSGVTVVPIRFVAESFGVELKYEASTKVISFVTETGKKIELKIGSKMALIDGTPVQLQAAPQIVKGKTMIPLRFVSEALGASVNYNASSKQITLTKPGCK